MYTAESKDQNPDELAQAFLASEARAAFIAHLISQSRAAFATDPADFKYELSFSERIADRVAAIGGS